MKSKFSFSSRGPDRVSEELATVLSKQGSWEFKSIFEMVHASLRSKDLVRGGEEMLRLRTYEKLQNFLQAGIVKKIGKEYVGVPKSLEAFFKSAEEFNAKFLTDPRSARATKPVRESRPAVAPLKRTAARKVEK